MLRIITLNLSYLADKHGPWEKRKDAILNMLRDRNPHIIALQAVAQHPGRYGGKDQAYQLCEGLHDFQSHYFEKAQTMDGANHGIAVIAKFPILEKSHIKLQRLPNVDDGNERVMLKTVFSRPGGKFALYNAHFSWVHEQAETNIREAFEFMHRDGPTAAIIAGDMNTLPDSNAFRPLHEAGFIDAWQRLNNGESGFTFEADKPSIRIDYFWVSPSLINQLNKVETLAAPAESPVRFSDHLGLLMELNIRLLPY